MTYIEREALVKEFNKISDHDVDVDEAIELIADFPAADVAPVKHGKWMPKPVMIRCLYAKNHYCSECKSENGATCNYCPNCGADMRGVADE
jgi:hypothetical protein